MRVGLYFQSWVADVQATCAWQDFCIERIPFFFAIQVSNRQARILPRAPALLCFPLAGQDPSRVQHRTRFTVSVNGRPFIKFDIDVVDRVRIHPEIARDYVSRGAKRASLMLHAGGEPARESRSQAMLGPPE